ncbi:MAG: nucleoside deaminase [Candidatus Margulisbacteria bacterium]|nr:nucleoside deaminase [Candidatus Margulisiibacteriota bacterium]
MEKICYMDKAYEQALLCLEHEDVPVGAIIVKDEKIVAVGRNKRVLENNALLHAEVDAIQNACKLSNNWRLDGATLYVTLEPCLMCVGAIIQARISKVVFGAIDAKAGCVVSKYKIFDEDKLIHKVQYDYNEDERCSKILTDFFEKKRKKA